MGEVSAKNSRYASSFRRGVLDKVLDTSVVICLAVWFVLLNSNGASCRPPRRDHNEIGDVLRNREELAGWLVRGKGGAVTLAAAGNHADGAIGCCATRMSRNDSQQQLPPSPASLVPPSLVVAPRPSNLVAMCMLRLQTAHHTGRSRPRGRRCEFIRSNESATTGV